VQAFHTALKEEGLAAATCNHHIKLLKHCFNLAIDWGYADANPIMRIKLFHEDNKVEHYLSDEQLAGLLHVLRTDANRSVCMIALFLLSTGCRLNEVLTAKWSDVDLEKGVFIVSAKNSKSKRLRAVPLNDSALEVLKQLDMQQEYLFMNHRTGQPLTTITKVWDRLRKAAGLPHLRLHDLRHQFASFLVNDGRTLYEVQQILGHSDPKVTMRYAHLSTKALREAANSAAVKIRG